MQTRRQQSRRKHYWLLAVGEDGKPYLIYGGADEDSARQHGLDVFSGQNFEVRGLPTRNLQMASSMIKGKRLDETHSLEKAKKRLGHDKSLERMRRRRRRHGD